MEGRCLWLGEWWWFAAAGVVGCGGVVAAGTAAGLVGLPVVLLVGLSCSPPSSAGLTAFRDDGLRFTSLFPVRGLELDRRAPNGTSELDVYGLDRDENELVLRDCDVDEVGEDGVDDEDEDDENDSESRCSHRREVDVLGEGSSGNSVCPLLLLVLLLVL